MSGCCFCESSDTCDRLWTHFEGCAAVDGFAIRLLGLVAAAATAGPASHTAGLPASEIVIVAFASGSAARIGREPELVVEQGPSLRKGKDGQ